MLWQPKNVKKVGMATHWKPQNKYVGLSYDRCLLRSVSSPSSCPMWQLCSHSYPLSLLPALFKRLLLWVAFWTFISLLSFTSFFFLAWLNSLVPYYPFPPACLYCLHDPWIPPSSAALCSLTDPDLKQNVIQTYSLSLTHTTPEDFWNFTFLLSFPDASAQCVRHRVNHWCTSLFSIIFKHYVRAKRTERVLLYTATPFYSCS